MNFHDVAKKSWTSNFESLELPSHFLFDDDAIKNFRENYRKFKFNSKEEYYDSISNKILLPINVDEILGISILST